MNWIWILVAIVLAAVLLKYYKRYFRIFTNALTLITGGVKSGKDTLMCSLGIAEYKRNVRRWYLAKAFMFWKKFDEKPVICTNFPIDVKGGYVKLTSDIVYGKVHLPKNSVILITEFSTFADFNSWKKIDNDRFSEFMKLCGHYYYKVYTNSQALLDCHYALKRSCSSMVYIERLIKTFPFFLIFKLRNVVVVDESVVNIADTEPDWFVCSKRIWKKFNSHCFYGFVKDTPLVNDTIECNYDMLVYRDDLVSLERSNGVSSSVVLNSKGGVSSNGK